MESVAEAINQELSQLHQGISNALAELRNLIAGNDKSTTLIHTLEEKFSEFSNLLKQLDLEVSQ